MQNMQPGCRHAARRALQELLRAILGREDWGSRRRSEICGSWGTEQPGVMSQRNDLNSAASAIQVTTETFVPDVEERIGVVTGQCA